MSEADIPRYEIAERALKKIEAVLADMEGSDWSHTRPAQEVQIILDVADAELRMAELRRDRRRPGWLAKVTSLSYPRGFTVPGEYGKDPDPHLCVTVEVTDGPKAVQGRRVEVQAPDSYMAELAEQILGMVRLRKKMKAEEEGR